MDTQLITDAINKAAELSRANDHDSAIQILNGAMQNPLAQKRMDLISRLLYSLQKMGRHQEVIEIASKACEMEDVWDSIKQNLAWSIYFQYFKKPESVGADEAILQLETMRQVFPQKKGLHPLPLSILNWIKAHPESSPSLQLQLCALIMPDMLDRSAMPIQGAKHALPSQFERFYGIMSKALFAQQNYQECLGLCKKLAKEEIQGISPNSRIWLQRRMALCLEALGEIDPAIAEMKTILIKKKDWFLYHETARMAFAMEDYRYSLKMAAHAASAWGDIENKIHLWVLLRHLMIKEKQFDRSIELLKLCASIRKFKGWGIKQEFMKTLQIHRIDLNELEHFKLIYKRTIPWWIELKQEDQAILRGKIVKLLPNGAAGFIQSDTKSYYFRLADCKFEPRNIIPGRKVIFQLQNSYDKKKQQESQIAVNIKME